MTPVELAVEEYRQKTPLWKKAIFIFASAPLLCLGAFLTFLARGLLALHPIDGVLRLTRWAGFPGEAFFFRPLVMSHTTPIMVQPPTGDVWRCPTCTTYTNMATPKAKCIVCGTTMVADVVNERGESIR